MDPEEEFMPPSKKQKCNQEEDPIGTDTKSCAVKEDFKPVTVSVAQADASLARHLSEKDVGITEYVGKHSGFFAVLKQRYSDFMVHEIDQNGGMVVLSDFSLPPDEEDKDDKMTQSSAGVLSEEDCQRLREIASSDDQKASHLIKVGEDKEGRTAIHMAIKHLFPKLTSSTCRLEDGSRAIKVTRSKFADDKRSSSAKWPRGRYEYCRFVLYKENRDTMEAVSILAKLLKSGTNTLHYAGTKDKRAITSQFVTAYRIKATRLAALNQCLKNIQLGDFTYVPHPLKLGDLRGNRFSLALRAISADDASVHVAVGSLRDHGFINYFGMQRFGTSVISTYQIGRCLLRCDWKGAVELVLKPRPGESPEVAKARKVWAESRDPAKALEVFPRHRNVEREVLFGLQKYGVSNALAAIQHIPKNTRLMYVHSYQSYLWNRVVSRRIREYGLQLVAGDLVLKAGRSVSRGCKGVDDLECVTDENLSQYSIQDLVVPLPGYDVMYPKNEVADWFKQIMAEDGIDFRQLDCKVKEFALSGSYRLVLMKPTDLQWSVVAYDDVTKPLLVSDLEKLNKEPQNVNVEPSSGSRHRALILEFTLPSSTYATMAVRELLRMDTSAHHQASLNSLTLPQLPPAGATEGEGEGPSGSTGGSDAAGDSVLDQGSIPEEQDSEQLTSS